MEEDSVPFIPRLGEHACRRAGRVRGEREAVLTRRPGDRRRGLRKLAGEAVRRVVDVDAPRHVAGPDHVERNRGRYRGTVPERVAEGELVQDGEIVDLQLGP